MLEFDVEMYVKRARIDRYRRKKRKGRSPCRHGKVHLSCYVRPRDAWFISLIAKKRNTSVDAMLRTFVKSEIFKYVMPEIVRHKHSLAEQEKWIAMQEENYRKSQGVFRFRRK